MAACWPTAPALMHACFILHGSPAPASALPQCRQRPYVGRQHTSCQSRAGLGTANACTNHRCCHRSSTCSAVGTASSSSSSSSIEDDAASAPGSSGAAGTTTAAAAPSCDLAQKPQRVVLPRVDWRRYNLQLLFVDRSDTVRARVAVGLFERIAEWNGYGRCMLAFPAGVSAADRQHPPMSTSAALMSQAALLGIRPKLFALPSELFEADDFYRYDVIVALDSSVREELLRMAQVENPEDPQWYEDKVCQLSSFAHYCGEEILRLGGSAVLQAELSRIVRNPNVLSSARAVSEIHSPSLTAGSQDWNAMVQSMVVSLAGLFQYLVDAYPPDLPEYDPL